jgi:hypothetical protein
MPGEAGRDSDPYELTTPLRPRYARTHKLSTGLCMKLLLISLLASCASSAATALVCCWWYARRLRGRFSLRPSAQLSNEITQLRSDLDSISVTVKRLHAKYGMRALRGVRAQEAASSSVDPLPGESRAQWKERVRKMHFGGNSAAQREE